MLALTIWQASDWPVSLWGQGELAHGRAYCEGWYRKVAYVRYRILFNLI